MTVEAIDRLLETIWKLRWYQLQTYRPESLQQAEKALREDLHSLLNQLNSTA